MPDCRHTLAMTSWGLCQFAARPWEEIHTQMADIAARSADLACMVDIVQSVLRSGVADELAGNTSMHDLVVTGHPVTAPPIEVIHVFAPGRLAGVPMGQVRIEHQASTGRNDALTRPADQAVGLFWRFVREKLGVTPSSGA